MKVLVNVVLLFSLLLLVISCTKKPTEINEILDPTDISFEIINIHTIKISWIDNSIGEDGYCIDKKINDGNWEIMYAIIEENSNEWIDENAEIDSAIQYRVYGYKETYYTVKITTEIIFNTFGYPSNLNRTILDTISIVLSWQDNSIGEEGFIIIHKINESEWIELANLTSNITNYTDNNIDNSNINSYCIYAYYNESVSLYSNELTVFPFDVVIDIDGNIYPTMVIGDQVWIAENLKVTHYNNGDEILSGFSDSDWSELDTGAYCVYDDNESNIDTYGCLYNWYAVEDSRNLAPEGWHVPADEEIRELEVYLGMSVWDSHQGSWRGTDEGSKLAGNASLWNNGYLETNTAFNTSGFNFIPGGLRMCNDGSFNFLGTSGYFWSYPEHNGDLVWGRGLNYNRSDIFRVLYTPRYGMSVRCIKD